MGVLLTTEDNPATTEVKLKRKIRGFLTFLKRTSIMPKRLKCSFNEDVIKIRRNIVITELLAISLSKSLTSITPTSVSARTTNEKTPVGLNRFTNRPTIIADIAIKSAILVDSGFNMLSIWLAKKRIGDQLSTSIKRKY